MLSESTYDEIQKKRQAVIGRIFKRLSLAFQEQATARIRKLGYEEYRASDNQVLMHLDLAGSRVTEIASRAKISKQALSKLVVDLERRDIVVKAPDPSDDRAQLVRFTSHGTRMMEDALEVVFQLDREFAEALPENRLDEIRNDLLSLLAVVDPQQA